MLKGQNLSDFPDSVKTIVYSSAAGLGYECGDDTEMYYWDALYNDVIGEGYGVVDGWKSNSTQSPDTTWIARLQSHEIISVPRGKGNLAVNVSHPFFAIASADKQ